MAVPRAGRGSPASGASDLSSALGAMQAADPVFPVTDLILLDHVARLRDGPRRLVEPGTPWRLSPRGAAVLAGEERHQPAPRFQGGVTVGPRSPWRWDPSRAGVIAVPLLAESSMDADRFAAFLREEHSRPGTRPAALAAPTGTDDRV